MILRGLRILALGLFCISVLIVYLNIGRTAARTFYVDSRAGHDANLGTNIAAAWKTIGRVNRLSLRPGDRVLFRRGSIWRETLRIQESGDRGQPIVIGAYGSGPPPRLSGGREIEGWKRLYSRNKKLEPSILYAALLPTKPDVVVVNGEVWDDRGSMETLDERTWAWVRGRLLIYPSSGNLAPKELRVEAAQLNHAVDARGVGFVTIRDLQVDLTNDWAIAFSGNFTDVKVLHSTVKWIGDVQDGAGAITFASGIRDAKVRHCRFVDLHRGKPLMFWNTSRAEVAFSSATISKLREDAHNGIQISGDEVEHNDYSIHDNFFDMRPKFPGRSPNKHVFNLADGIGGKGGYVGRNIIRGGAGGIEIRSSGRVGSHLLVEFNDIAITGKGGGGITIRPEREIANVSIRHNRMREVNVGIEIWDHGNDDIRDKIIMYGNHIFNARSYGIQIRSPMRRSSFYHNFIWSPQARALLRVDSVEGRHSLKLRRNIYGPLGTSFIYAGKLYETFEQYQRGSRQDSDGMVIEIFGQTKAETE